MVKSREGGCYSESRAPAIFVQRVLNVLVLSVNKAVLNKYA